MTNITVSKDRILKILKSNKEKHIKEYNEALTAFYTKAAMVFSSMMEKALNSDPSLTINEVCELIKPISHQEEYELVIRMLQMDLNEVVDLSRQEYTQYIDDNWTWTQQFKSINSSYTIQK